MAVSQEWFSEFAGAECSGWAVSAALPVGLECCPASLLAASHSRPRDMPASPNDQLLMVPASEPLESREGSFFVRPAVSAREVMPAAVAASPDGINDDTTGNPHPGSQGVSRQIAESLICLFLAVIVFRTFALEGYIISTGSMAPGLLGYHKRVQCPDCHFRFEFGVAFDRDEDSLPSQLATCPNCGQNRIDVTSIPRNDGDQLLVFKNAFSFRDPKRWEVIVFLSPHSSTQAFVKRVAGLPGEEIQIRDGDLFVNGHREKKPLSLQRTLRIPVFDNARPGHLPGWLPRWLSESGWIPSEGGFAFSTPFRQSKQALESSVRQAEYQLSRHSERPGEIAWLRYFHWPRQPADTTAASVERPPQVFLTPAAVSDQYGYNRPVVAALDRADVNDLMVTARISLPDADSELTAVVRQRNSAVVCRLSRVAKQIQAWLAEPGQSVVEVMQHVPLTSVSLPQDWLEHQVAELEVSTFDTQLAVSINQQELLTLDLEAYEAKESGRDSDDISSRREDLSPVWLGAAGGRVEVTELMLYRDVHYTSSENGHATARPLKLGADDFFVLGDNSPVSLDSRGWKSPAVPRHLLVGRPLVVHLPSRPGRIEVGAWQRTLRIPDFSRIRCIR